MMTVMEDAIQNEMGMTGCNLRSGLRVVPPGKVSGALLGVEWLGTEGVGASFGSSIGTDVYSLLAMAKCKRWEGSTWMATR